METPCICMMQKHHQQKLRIPATVPTPGTTTGKLPPSSYLTDCDVQLLWQFHSFTSRLRRWCPCAWTCTRWWRIKNLKVLLSEVISSTWIARVCALWTCPSSVPVLEVLKLSSVVPQVPRCWQSKEFVFMSCVQGLLCDDFYWPLLFVMLVRPQWNMMMRLRTLKCGWMERCCREEEEEGGRETQTSCGKG